MTRLARFVESPEGQIYARSCEFYGTDPGAIFSDEVLALNARVGFLAAAASKEDEPEGPGIITDLAEQMRAMAHG